MIIEEIISGIVREEIKKAFSRQEARAAVKAHYAPKNGLPSAVPAAAPPMPSAAAPAPPAPPAAKNSPAPAPVAPHASGITYTVVNASLSEGSQKYLNVALEGTAGDRGVMGSRVTFRFLLNASTEPTKGEWVRCLSEFLIAVGLPQMTDTDELLGRRVTLENYPQRTTIASHVAIRDLIKKDAVA